MRVGIVLGDETREIFAKTISRFFDIYVYRLPDDLPPVLDDGLEFPKEIFETDIILSYAFHPDVNVELVRKAEESRVKIVLIAGNFRFLRKRSRKIRIIVEDVCCSTFVKGCEFFEKFGIPEFEVSIDEFDRLEDVKVIRSALCGATFFVADNLRGVCIEDAPTKAGYLTQIYPCLASRGVKGGIHKAARIHKLAIERAIRRAIGEDKLNSKG